MKLQTGTPSVCKESKLCSEGSKMLFYTFPTFARLFLDQSFYQKVNLLAKVMLQTRTPFGGTDFKKFQEALKRSHKHFLLLSIFSKSLLL